MPIALLIPLITAALPVLLEIIKALEAAAAPGSTTAPALATIQTLFDTALVSLSSQLGIEQSALWPFVVQIAALFGIVIPPKAN